MTILVVEDNNDLRLCLVQALKNYFRTVLEAKNGLEAIELIELQTINVVLSDIEMPLMDGVELLAAINAIRANRPLVYIMSGGTKKYTKQQVLRLGAEDFFEKPLEIGRLSEIFQNFGRTRT